MQMKGTSDSSSYLRLEVYGHVTLEPGYSGTAYTWSCDYDVASQAFPFSSVQHWKTGSGLGTRLMKDMWKAVEEIQVWKKDKKIQLNL